MKLPGPTIALRIIHDNGPPPSGSCEPYEFGLQDKTGALRPGVPLGDGTVALDCELRVVLKDGRLNFLGDFAQGPTDDRFLYLSWKRPNAAPGAGVWINRVHVRLSPIRPEQVLKAQAGGGRLEASAIGRRPHDAKLPDWRVAG